MIKNRYTHGDNPASGDPPCFDKFKMFCKTFITCIAKAMPAPLAWLMVGLLRGEMLTCAFWPTKNGMINVPFPECAAALPEDVEFPLPCQIPKTYETIVEGCGAVSKTM